MYRLIHLCMLIAIVLGKHIHDQPSSIISGDLARIQDFPYYVALGYGEGPASWWLNCGGAIIRPDIILTAAHCVSRKDIKVFVGLTSLDDMLTATPYETDKVLAHPGFDWRGSYNDVALLKLKKNITLDQVKVDTIGISHDNPPIGVNATVMGFGIAECEDPTSRWCEGPSSEHLRTATVTVSKIDGNNVLYTRSRNQASCSGDSGGPLVYDGQVIGVLSTVENSDCTGYNTMGPIPFNYYWIKKHMNCL